MGDTPVDCAPTPSAARADRKSEYPTIPGLARSSRQASRLELGYVPASKVDAELLFDVLSTAHERTSLVVTGNLPFEPWTEVFGSERLTGATLDRLYHRCNIIETKGESYRLQDAKARTRRAKPTTDLSGGQPVDQAQITK